MKNNVLNNEIKKQHELLLKRHDDFLLGQIEKIRVAFVEAGVYANSDINQFAKDIAPFLVIKTVHGDYRDGLIEFTSRLEASEYLKAFMDLDLFNEK